MTWQALVPLIVLVVLLLGGTIVARRLGYEIGGAVVVRCLDGHLFTTIWVPGASLKALRLGWVRMQRCPVSNHLTLVTPVKDADLTYAERRIADQYHDVWVP